MVWSITFWSLPIFKKLIQFLRLPSNLTQISFPYLSRAAVWSGKILSSHATSKHNYSSGLGEGARRENNMNIPSLNCPGLQSSVPLCWFSSEHLLVTDGLLTGGHPNAVFPQGHICGFFWALFSLSWRVPAWILPYLSNSGSPRCSPVFSDSYFSVLDPCKLISFLSQTAEGRWSTNPSSPPLSLADKYADDQIQWREDPLYSPQRCFGSLTLFLPFLLSSAYLDLRAVVGWWEGEYWLY